MNVAARRNLLLLLCSAALFSGCGILGNETHDGRRVKRWSKEWYEMESQAPVGARQEEHAGQLWPPFARPTGEDMQFSHKYHHAHYWPYPYNCEDRDFVRSLSAQQVANGWVSHTTLYDYHFDAETHQLNNSGNLKLKWILEHAPAERRMVSIQSGSSAVVSEGRMAAVRNESIRIVGESNMAEIAMRVTEPLGRPATEVDGIRRAELLSMPSPRITYTSLPSGNAGGGE
jgi:hypothetical protein